MASPAAIADSITVAMPADPPPLFSCPSSRCHLIPVPSETTVIEHFAAVHPAQLREVEPLMTPLNPDDPWGINACTQCNYTDRKLVMIRHLVDAHDLTFKRKTLKCPFCQTVVDTVLTHIKRNHRQESNAMVALYRSCEPDPTKPGYSLCPLCEDSLKTMNMRKHLYRRHTDQCRFPLPPAEGNAGGAVVPAVEPQNDANDVNQTHSLPAAQQNDNHASVSTQAESIPPAQLYHANAFNQAQMLTHAQQHNANAIFNQALDSLPAEFLAPALFPGRLLTQSRVADQQVSGQLHQQWEDLMLTEEDETPWTELVAQSNSEVGLNSGNGAGQEVLANVDSDEDTDTDEDDDDDEDEVMEDEFFHVDF